MSSTPPPNRKPPAESAQEWAARVMRERGPLPQRALDIVRRHRRRRLAERADIETPQPPG